MYYRCDKNNGGFSVVELAIVMIITSLMLVAFLQLYQVYRVDTSNNKTIEHIEALDSSLINFMSTNYFYPCPADPTLPVTHVDYGKAVLCGLGNLSGNCSVERPRLPTFPNPISNVSCAVATGVDRNNDGTDDMALIGMFPFKTLQDQAASGLIADNFREFQTFDGQGMRFTYAVTENMAGPDGLSRTDMLNPHLGAIGVFDENNQSVTDPPNSAHYVLVSHGLNRRGAYTPEGTQVQNCILGGVPAVGLDDITVPAYASAGLNLEIENCDHVVTNNPTDSDAIFRKAIRSDNDANPTFFDDIVYYTSNYALSLWQISNASGVQRRYLYNTNLGNVGVGKDMIDPISKLHVLGDMEVGVEVAARDGFCPPDARDGSLALPPECMRPQFLAGPTTSCPATQVAVAIDRNNLVCEPLFKVAPNFAGATCGLDSSDIDGDGDTIEQLYASGMTYNRITGVVTVDCMPL